MCRKWTAAAAATTAAAAAATAAAAAATATTAVAAADELLRVRPADVREHVRTAVDAGRLLRVLDRAIVCCEISGNRGSLRGLLSFKLCNLRGVSLLILDGYSIWICWKGVPFSFADLGVVSLLSVAVAVCSLASLH